MLRSQYWPSFPLSSFTGNLTKMVVQGSKELAQGVCKQAGLDYDACKILATLKGADFELMAARHPLLDQDSCTASSGGRSG